MPRLTIPDAEILQAALLGLSHKLAEVTSKIAGLHHQLGGRKPMARKARARKAAPKRVLSPAARRRISLAQKKRWATFRKSRTKAAA